VGRATSFNGLSLWSYRQGMEVNGYKIEPGANLMEMNHKIWRLRKKYANIMVDEIMAQGTGRS